MKDSEMSKIMGFIKNVSESSTFRLTQPEGNNRTVALLIDKIGDGSQNISVGQCTIDAKSQIPYHVHEIEEEAMYILSGRGIAKIGGSEYDLHEGSIMFVTPKIHHQIINPYNQKLTFLFIYGPSGPEQAVRSIGKLQGQLES